MTARAEDDEVQKSSAQLAAEWNEYVFRRKAEKEQAARERRLVRERRLRKRREDLAAYKRFLQL